MKALGRTRPPNVAILSSYFENVGDDLIRHGVQHQITAALGAAASWRYVSKSNMLSLNWPISPWTHAPVMRMSPSRQRRSKALARLMERGGGFVPDKLRGADVFVVAGTPLFYFVADSSFLDVERLYAVDWPNALFAKRVEHADGLRMIALGVGSIYEGSPEDRLARHPEAAAFIRRFVARSSLVTTRDAATDALVRSASPDVRTPIVRSICPAFWAREEFGVAVAPRPKRVSISFTLESVNWDLSAPREAIEHGRIRAFELVLDYFQSRGYDVDLIAHNHEAGLEVASAIAARRNLGLPRVVRARELIESVSQAELVATWRVHGALAARSAGRPALLFRTDPRWPMAVDLGASMVDDRSASADEIVTALDALCVAARSDPNETLARADAVRAEELRQIAGPLADALAG